jgi:hypothetical protein
LKMMAAIREYGVYKKQVLEERRDE